MPKNAWTRWTQPLLAATLALSLATAGCGDDDADPSGRSAAGRETAAPKCGAGTGEKAAGEPIKLGAISTKMPGVDLSQSSQIAHAFFECVNDNGGINGRPVEYVSRIEKTDPQSVSALATRLVEDEGVLGMVGGASLLDCVVNHEYYEKHGVFPILVGTTKECFSTPNIAPVNLGAYYSTIGAGQYLLDQGAKSLVAATGEGPGLEYANFGAVELAKRQGVPGKSLQDPMPVTDGAAAALKYVEAAGEGGGVILDFPASESLKVLRGAEQQGLIDKVKWACATPCNDASLVKALGPAWDRKLGVNAELNLPTADGDDAELYRAVTAAYASDVPLSTFGQAGFLTAKIATEALLGVTGELTRESVNRAFVAVEGFESDMLCKPWYFGKGEVHVPNNTDYTLVPEGGKFEVAQECIEIAALPGNPLAEIRKAEEAGS